MQLPTQEQELRELSGAQPEHGIVDAAKLRVIEAGSNVPDRFAVEAAGAGYVAREILAVQVDLDAVAHRCGVAAVGAAAVD